MDVRLRDGRESYKVGETKSLNEREKFFKSQYKEIVYTSIVYKRKFHLNQKPVKAENRCIDTLNNLDMGVDYLESRRGGGYRDDMFEKRDMVKNIVKRAIFAYCKQKGYDQAEEPPPLK